MSDFYSQAVRDVIAERVRQVHGEGMTPEGDDANVHGEIAMAGAAYAIRAAAPTWSGVAQLTWPKTWARDWFKAGDVRRMLVKAAALIIAEIERLDRRAARGLPLLVPQPRRLQRKAETSRSAADALRALQAEQAGG